MCAGMRGECDLAHDFRRAGTNGAGFLDAGRDGFGLAADSTTNRENPNAYRLGFFLPKTPVLARFRALAAAEAVEPVNDNTIDLVGLHIVEQLTQSRAIQITTGVTAVFIHGFEGLPVLMPFRTDVGAAG